MRHGDVFALFFLCFDTKSLGLDTALWQVGKRPTEVMAIFEVDELKTHLLMASGWTLVRMVNFSVWEDAL